jgi:hypothetical protein
MDTVDVDPELVRQLDAATADEPVEAVLVLRPTAEREQSAGSPPRPALDAEALMRWAGQQDGAAEMRYMPRLGALVIRASSRVIRALLVQPQVETASANRAREL